MEEEDKNLPYVDANDSLSKLRREMKEDSARRAKQTKLQNFIEDIPWWLTYGIKNKISDLKFHIRVKFNRHVHGYDQCDWWEFYSNASERAVKLLTMLKEKGHGFKCMRRGEHDCWDGICQKKWNEALDDMIFFHRVCAGQYEELNEDGISFSRDYWIMDNQESKKRYLRGKYMYFKHYEGLWD